MSYQTNFTQFGSFIRDIQYFRAVRRTRTERTQLIDTALDLVNRRHRTFNSLGFDHAFLFNEIFDEIQPFLYGGSAPTPQALANAWAERFRFPYHTQCELARRVLPLMTDFVYLLGSSSNPSAAPQWLGRESLQGSLVLQA